MATWWWAVGIETAVRYVLIGLGVVTLVLAALLAREGQWWAAIPDAGFGAGVGWVAYVSLREERAEQPPQPAPPSHPAPPTAAPEPAQAPKPPGRSGA